MSDRRFGEYGIGLRFTSGHIVLTIAMGLLLTGCPNTPTGQEITFKAALVGSHETPLVTSIVNPTGHGTASGHGTFTLNAAQTQLTFDISITGLSGPVTAAHFHSGLVGETGPVVFDILSTVVENYGLLTAKGTWTLSEADFTNLLAGHVYVDFHTAMHGNGEVRGQLTQNQ